jgi:hypothetical protein
VNMQFMTLPRAIIALILDIGFLLAVMAGALFTCHAWGGTDPKDFQMPQQWLSVGLVGGMAAFLLWLIGHHRIIYLDSKFVARFVNVLTFHLPQIRILVQLACALFLLAASKLIWDGYLFAEKEETMSSSLSFLLRIMGGGGKLNMGDVTSLSARILACLALLALAGFRFAALSDPRDFYAYPRLTQHQPPKLNQPGFRIAHLSDIHVTAREAATEGGSTNTDKIFSAALETLTHQLAVASKGEGKNIDMILISGDITDRGTAVHWNAFDAIIAQHHNLRNRLVLLHGNHDLNFSAVSSWWFLQLMDPQPHDGRRRAECRLRVLDAMLRLMPSAQVLRELDLVPLCKEFGPRINKLYSDANQGALEVDGVEDVWNRVFPVVVAKRAQEPNGAKLGVILLDSIAPTSSVASNAYGYVWPAQLEKLPAIAALLRKEGAIPMVVLHHHPAMHYSLWAGASTHTSRENKLRRMWRRFRKEALAGMLVIENSDELFDALANARIRLVFHGHQHHREMGRDEPTGVLVVGAGSTTKDSWDDHNDPEEPNFTVLTLVPDQDGDVLLSESERWIYQPDQNCFQLTSVPKPPPAADEQSPAVDHRSPAVDHHSPAVDHQPQVLDARTQTIDGQPQAVDGQPQAVDGQPQAVDGQPQAVDGQPQAVDGQPQAVDHHSPAVDHQPQADHLG